MCRWLPQVGEVEKCEVLHTLSTILGRVLNSVVLSEENEVGHMSRSFQTGPYLFNQHSYLACMHPSTQGLRMLRHCRNLKTVQSPDCHHSMDTECRTSACGIM